MGFTPPALFLTGVTSEFASATGMMFCSDRSERRGEEDCGLMKVSVQWGAVPTVFRHGREKAQPIIVQAPL